MKLLEENPRDFEFVFIIQISCNFCSNASLEVELILELSFEQNKE